MENNVKLIANLLEDKHAKDIEIFELGSAHPLFDTVIIASVDVEKNFNAIIGEFKEAEKEGKITVKNYDLKNKQWVIIDLYEVVVHIFLGQTREEYNLERLLEEYVTD